MRVSDDLHRELADERIGLSSPQAIIGAGGARVERAYRPTGLRPEPPTESPLTRGAYELNPRIPEIRARCAAYAPHFCGERKRPARKASGHSRIRRSSSAPRRPGIRLASHRS